MKKGEAVGKIETLKSAAEYYCDENDKQALSYALRAIEENQKLRELNGELVKASEAALAYCYGSTNDNPEKLLEAVLQKAREMG